MTGLKSQQKSSREWLQENKTHSPRTMTGSQKSAEIRPRVIFGQQDTLSLAQISVESCSLYRKWKFISNPPDDGRNTRHTPLLHEITAVRKINTVYRDGRRKEGRGGREGRECGCLFPWISGAQLLSYMAY